MSVPDPQSLRKTLLLGAAALSAFLAALVVDASKNHSQLQAALVPTFAAPGTAAMVGRQNSLHRPMDTRAFTAVLPGAPGPQLQALASSSATPSLHSFGLAALCVSFALAVSGFVIRTLGTAIQEPHYVVSPMALQGQPEAATWTLAAATAKKDVKRTKILKKGSKTKKDPKEEKPEKVPIVLTPKEVMKKMHKAVLRRAALGLLKKRLKTTGRVCQLLGKIDNRQARAVSFSKRRTRRIQMVNLQWRRLWWEEGQCFVRLRLSTKGIKTITKYGLHQAAIKFGLDLTKHVNGVSARKYVKHLPDKDKKVALMRGGELRYKNAVRWAKLNDLEVPLAPTLPKADKKAKKEAEPAVIAMAVSHGRRVPRLGRPADQRRALLRSLTTELIRHGRIKTTTVKAKAMRKHVDHMITLAKGGTLHHRRQALSFMFDGDLVRTLFQQVPERYGAREGGYTRIIRTMPRKGDAADMCYIELL